MSGVVRMFVCQATSSYSGVVVGDLVVGQLEARSLGMGRGLLGGRTSGHRRDLLMKQSLGTTDVLFTLFSLLHVFMNQSIIGVVCFRGSIPCVFYEHRFDSLRVYPFKKPTRFAWISAKPR
jgi:hypothetical protein